MESKLLSKILSESLRDFIKNPILVLPTILSTIILTLLALLSFKVNSILSNQNSLLPTIWLIIFLAIALLVLSYLFAGLISLCFASIKEKAKLKDFFSGANKYWLKNFVIVIIIYVLYNLIRAIAHFGALYIGKVISLSTENAAILFFIIYFAGIISIIIFMTFSNFILIKENLSIVKSIKKSIAFVKANYLQTLSISLGFFISLQIIGYIDRLNLMSIISLSEIISSLFVYPLLAIVLARFLSEK